MTDAADKAKEIVNKYLLDVAMPVGKLMHVESAILSAIESAVQAERERAGKLVEAAKEVVPAINASEDLSNRKRDAFKAALAAYDEVQP